MCRSAWIVVTVLLAGPAWAKVSTPPSSASPGAREQQLAERVLGRLNVNLATRGELLAAGLDASSVDRLLRDRARRPIADLSGFPAELRRHLRTDGPSDFRRIRQLPLERYTGALDTTMACR